MQKKFPYGAFLYPDGQQALFNRFYERLAVRQRQPGSVPETEWFYHDGNPPWADKNSLLKCQGILMEWGLPQP